MQPYKARFPIRMLRDGPHQGRIFRHGHARSRSRAKKDEGPTRTVKIDPFWMGKYEVSWDEYRLFMFSKWPRRRRVKTRSWMPLAGPPVPTWR